MPGKRAIKQIEGEAALYALGALAPGESEKFKQRLAAGCPVCQNVLDDCRQVVNLLPLAAPSVDPPPSIRARLMDRIGAESRAAAMTNAMGEGLLVRAGEGDWK